MTFLYRSSLNAMPVEYILLLWLSDISLSRGFHNSGNIPLSPGILLPITLFVQLSIICPKPKTGNSGTNLVS